MAFDREMNKHLSIDEQIRRGEAAARVLAEPVLKDALEAMKREIIAQWSATPARDAEGREWVWRHYKITERFEAMLNGFVQTGRFERLKIEKDAKTKVVDWFKRAA